MQLASAVVINAGMSGHRRIIRSEAAHKKAEDNVSALGVKGAVTHLCYSPISLLFHTIDIENKKSTLPQRSVLQVVPHPLDVGVYRGDKLVGCAELAHGAQVLCEFNDNGPVTQIAFEIKDMRLDVRG